MIRANRGTAFFRTLSRTESRRHPRGQQGSVTDPTPSSARPALPRRLAPALLGPLLAALPVAGQDFTDPAPPKVGSAPENATAGEPEDFDRLTHHAEPKPLSPDAATADWPRFLGPNGDATSPETHLLDEFPEGGPLAVWEMEKGTGYTSPVIVDDRLIFIHRLDDEEVIECLHPETGRRFWRHAYPVQYTDRFGFNNGPRASAVIDSGKVYTLGVTSTLTCLDLASGARLWQRDLDAEFDRADYFFGHGSCPLVHDGKVVVPLGTSDGLSVAAFDQHTGRLAWGARHEWNAGYASPIVAELQGAPRILVFAGGESRPATGGLLCIDPDSGEVHDAFPWRADKYESVNGSTPVAVGNDRVFISDTYQIGGVLLELDENLEWTEVWRTPDFGMHWMTPLHLGDHLYGFGGRNEPDAYLAAYDVATGEEAWRVNPEWSIDLPGGRDYRMRYFRGSLLHADDKTFALGEFGALGILDLSPEGMEEIDRTQLFVARATWSLPVLHRGLLYVSQHERGMDGSEPRVICYDLRAAGSE